MNDEPNNQSEDGKNPVGRPLKFKTVEELDAAIEHYLGDSGPHIAQRKIRMMKDDGTYYWAVEEYMTEQQPLTVSDAAVALGTTRKTLLGYKDREEFLPSIERLLTLCEAYAERQLFGPYANGAKFNLQNNYNGKYQPWTDKQVISGDPDAPLGLFGSDALTVKVINAGTDTESEAADDVSDS